MPKKVMLLEVSVEFSPRFVLLLTPLPAPKKRKKKKRKKDKLKADFYALSCSFQNQFERRNVIFKIIRVQLVQQ